MGQETEQVTSENVDQLLSDAYEPTAPLEAPTEDKRSNYSNDETGAESSTQTSSPFKINYKGKELELDEDKIKSYAQKGYDYEKKMHDFKVQTKLQQKELEKKQKELEELAEINEFAKQNPQFEQLIQREWAKVQSGQELEVRPEDKVSLLESRLNQVLEKMSATERAEAERRAIEMEASQETAIEKYKEQYKDFDWQTKDENGATLEDRIMQEMVDKGVKDFEIMADHVLRKEQLARKELESKKEIGKQIQYATKHGLGKVTNTSQKQTTKAQDIRGKSYDDLVAEGLRELGIDY